MSSLFETQISKPFDPASLRVEVKNTTVGQLADMLRNNMIDLQPDFQRHGNLWSRAKKSRLIESIILGLPLPSFYFYIDSEQERWVVIDGLQRLCSINDFMVEKKLKLAGLQFLNDEHKGHQFGDFSYFEQLDMSMRSVTLNVISGASSAEAKYIIFQRINSEGTKLSPAEIRNALFHGKSMEMVKEFAESAEFQDATAGKVSKTRLMHYDFVSRFLSFFILGVDHYESNKMDAFIGNALQQINDQYSEEKKNYLQQLFFNSLVVCKSLLGDEAFRQPLGKDEKRNKDIRQNPISISLFESMMCSIARLSETDQKRLIEKKTIYRNLYEKMFDDEFLKKELSNGTNQSKSVLYRFSKMDELVYNILK